MQLVAVPPDRAAEAWPHVSHWIKAAMERAKLGSFLHVERTVLNEDALLWLAWNGKAIVAAAVTEIHETEWRRVCVIVACGGEHMKDWLHLIGGIEDYARAEGCSATRILGPRAWGIALDGYRTAAVILERQL